MIDHRLVAPSRGGRDGLDRFNVAARRQGLGILIDIEAAYTQCSKAFIRSQLWDASRFVSRDELPTNGEIHKVMQGESFDAAQYDAERAARYARREGFY